MYAAWVLDWGNRMFVKIQNKLKLVYAFSMAFLLIAFVTVIYASFKWQVHVERKKEIRVLAQQIAAEQMELLKRDEAKNTLVNIEKETDRDISGQTFYYLYDARGRELKADMPFPRLGEVVAREISVWSETGKDVRIIDTQMGNGQKITLMVVAQKVYDGPNLLGTVYAGRDVTGYYRVLERMIVPLLGVSMLFLSLVLLVARYFSAKAMIPIKAAYTRQRAFIADASHELRTPLSILMTALEVLATDRNTVFSPFAGQMISDIKDEIRKMSKIVSNMLTLARADAGVNVLYKEEFDLVPVVKQVVRAMHPLAVSKGTGLRCRTPERVLVYADKEKLKQLLQILIDNGIKYTPVEGTVEISVDFSPKQATAVTVTVRDTGIGIAEEHRKFIFERFYRIDKVRSRKEGGTGLGLAIARWITEAHGGKIEVDSTPGQGSRFIVNLPAVKIVD